MINLALAAIEGTRLSYRFSRLQEMTEWWHWLLLAAVFVFVSSYVWWMYRRDGVELPRPYCAALIVLRVAAFCGLLFFFLDLEKRSERSTIKKSRLALLVDTSQSMALPDAEGGSIAARSRADRVRLALADGKWINELRRNHEVVVYRFDQGVKPTEVVAYSKFSDNSESPSAYQSTNGPLAASASWAMRSAFVLLGLCGLGIAWAVWSGRVNTRTADDQGSWGILIAMLCGISGCVVLGVISLRYPSFDLAYELGLRSQPSGALPVENQPRSDPAEVEQPVDWDAQLRPAGFETRLADAIRFVVNKERGGSIAGIVLVSDGGHNSGTKPAEAIAVARQSGVPIFPIGLGSEKRPLNVRAVDLEAPPRVYPGDRFSLTGYLQAYGYAGRTIKVELVSQASDKERTTKPERGEAEHFESEKRITLAGDGELMAVRFDVTPDRQGRREFRMRVTAPDDDHDASDNFKTAEVEVVERRSKVLLIAGGPNRDFQFLRNMLFRARESDVDVFLQSGRPGISQEADDLLFEFPKTANELFEYDTIVAFDPDWSVLDELQVELLDRWVAEKAGGLIAIAGPVFTQEWSNRTRSDMKLERVQGLYPVSFFSSRESTTLVRRSSSSTARSLQFSRDGQEAEFLWLDDSVNSSEKAWSEFPGVFASHPVKDAKRGARVYARVADADSPSNDQQPIYMAGHFYGAGRVFYLGSAEMWRLRGLDEKYFETFYTKLIRWVSQGRLLRDSSRGVLLVEKDRCLLGDDVEFRTILNNSQFEPLQAETVAASVVQPDGIRNQVTMRRLKDSPREGTFFASFTPQQVGDYRVELQPPESSDKDLLIRDIRVLAPQLETERPERNDPLLAEIAQKTGGQYYVGMDAALGIGTAQRGAIANLIDPRDQVTYLPGTPDREFERRLMTWLLGLISGVLCCEWLLRRLSRLA